MRKRLIALLVAAAALSFVACGREGYNLGNPNPAVESTQRFCAISNDLEQAFQRDIDTHGANPPEEVLLELLRAFVTAHQAEYAEQLRVAPPEIRSAVALQQALRRAIFAARDQATRNALFARLLANGRRLANYRLLNCGRNA